MNHNARGIGGRAYPGSGPLMTGHLQIQDLDRELEILRHKREQVQREQQMLSRECDIDRKRQYRGPNRNVPNMYDKVGQPPPSKRANIPQQAIPWTGAVQDRRGLGVSQPMLTNYIPSLLNKNIGPPLFPVAPKPIVHPILQNTSAYRPSRPINMQNEFHPTQVTKKKPKPPPNKLNSYPVEERKDLVSKAIGSLSAVNKGNKFPEDSETMVLREDRMPNKQVIGRLELALGSIVKEIKKSNSHNNTFKTLIASSFHQRNMKQAVRERLRTVMLNKTVGTVADILKKYREKFPKHTDKDLAEVVINSEQPSLMNFIETENPEEFFKKNISSILEKKIQEMSTVLLKIYKTSYNQTTLAYVKVADNINKNTEEPGGKESVLNNEMAMKLIRAITSKYVTIEERNLLTKYYTELIEDILDKKLPEYLPKCKDQFIKIFDLDRNFKAVKLIATKYVRDEAIKKGSLDVINQIVSNTETPDKNEKMIKESSCKNEIKEVDSKSHEEETINESIVMGTDAVNKNDNINDHVVTENNEMETDAVTKDNEIDKKAVHENNDIEEKTLTQNILGKEVSAEVNTDAEIPTTLISNNAQVSPVKVITATVTAERAESNSITLQSPVMPSGSLTKELPYYVKLIGRPKLPNRPAICDFLNKYQPNSIKKHKTINNLLVVGFNNQENYKKILTANATIIDDITIIIKASEKIAPGKENEAIKGNDNQTQNEVNVDNNCIKLTENKDKTERKLIESGICKETTDQKNSEDDNQGKDFIGMELNAQITDLLSTIKEVEDENINISESGDNSNKESSLETDNGTSQHSQSAGCPLEPIKEGTEKNQNTHEESNKCDKSSKVKESGRATPVRSSSRLANVTPSTIRTRRSSRLMQE